MCRIGGAKMKILKPKLKDKHIKPFYDAYLWGFTDAKNGEKAKSFEEVKSSIKRGFDKGVKQKTNN